MGARRDKGKSKGKNFLEMQINLTIPYRIIDDTNIEKLKREYEKNPSKNLRKRIRYLEKEMTNSQLNFKVQLSGGHGHDGYSSD